MRLDELITQFAAEYSRLADQSEAYGMCQSMTEKFIEFARDNGYEGTLRRYSFYADEQPELNPDREMYNVVDERGILRKNENGFTMCGWHCIAEADECFIDFTARQYSLKNPFPAIIHKQPKVTI